MCWNHFLDTSPSQSSWITLTSSSSSSSPVYCAWLKMKWQVLIVIKFQIYLTQPASEWASVWAYVFVFYFHFLFLWIASLLFLITIEMSLSMSIALHVFCFLFLLFWKKDRQSSQSESVTHTHHTSHIHSFAAIWTWLWQMEMKMKCFFLPIAPSFLIAKRKCLFARKLRRYFGCKLWTFTIPTYHLQYGFNLPPRCFLDCCCGCTAFVCHKPAILLTRNG